MSAPDTTTLIRASTCRRMPWKNGGGETVEIALAPPDAALETFDWRVSMATVATDGPFSSFPGVDRTLCLLDGRGLVLTVGTAAPVHLTPASAPYPFPADSPTAAVLEHGAVTDLNVMTRRGRCTHHVVRIALDAATSLPVDGDTRLAFVAAGRVRIGGDLLERHDTLLMTGPADWTALPIDGPALLLLATIRDTQAP